MGTLGRGGTFGVLSGTNGMFTGTDRIVEVVATLAGLSVVAMVGTDFKVVVGRSVVVVLSLSLDLNSPVKPLKKPFFLVVSSGASVVVVVVVRWMGGKGLKSASEYVKD